MALQLYTQDFYRTVVEPKLAPDGIFVTQSGPAGVLTCSEVFSPINHTLNSVFPRVVPYLQHIPSYVDTWVGLLLTPLCCSGPRHTSVTCSFGCAHSSTNPLLSPLLPARL